MSEPVRVLGISGSLRKGSFNTALLRAAITLAPASLQIEVASIGDIPLYNEDVRAQGYPEPVAKLRERIAAADALLVVTPEYNYSIPGVLKNAIDWASRQPSSPLNGKPLAIMGASGSLSGTMRAQYHLRQMAVFLDMHALNRPEIFVRNAASAFDAEGKLTDETTKKLIVQQLEALAAWTRKLRA
jgi:chromate reductase, NAD(P)H dehydrogenase (quinone)